MVVRNSKLDLVAGSFSFTGIKSEYVGSVGLLGLKVDGYAATGYCVSPFTSLASKWTATDTLKLEDIGPVSKKSLDWSLSDDQVKRIAYLAGKGVTTRYQAADVQLAIWSVEFEGHHESISGLPFWDFKHEVKSLLNDAKLNAPSNYTYSLLTPTGCEPSQKVILHSFDPKSNIEAVPEPFTMGLGIAGLGAFLRRRLKK